MKNLPTKIRRLISDKRFSRFVIGFFIFESAWIALTASYPQAFDENFHFGLIKVYSHYWLPFLDTQPPNADIYGAVARDPSYLYHYLMSFPYRLIAYFVHQQPYQIILMRFINIGLFTSGLVLFRRILIKTKLSIGLANIIILLFALIPIVPQLAGQINYDNLLFPLVALVCLLCFKLIDEIHASKLSFKTPMYIAIVSTFTSLVKYAFLPIFISIIIFFSIYLTIFYRKRIPKLIHSFTSDFKQQKLWLKIALTSLLIIGLGMFIQRDVVNLVKYHAIEPDCSKVLTISQCSQYSPWYSDYTRHLDAVRYHVAVSTNPLYYLVQWSYWMWYRLFFAVDGPTHSYQNYPPLPLPSFIAAIIGIIGLFLVFKHRQELFKGNPYALFILTASIFYLVALIFQGYSTYKFTDYLENMNGRYLLPILLLLVALFGKAFSIAMSKTSLRAKMTVTLIVVLMFVEGGGIVTFISRSDESWDWHNTKVIRINNAARHITSHVVINGRKTYNTKVWVFN